MRRVIPNTGVGGKFLVSIPLKNFGGLGGRPLASLCALVSWTGLEATSPTQTATINKSEHWKFIILCNGRDPTVMSPLSPRGSFIKRRGSDLADSLWPSWDIFGRRASRLITITQGGDIPHFCISPEACRRACLACFFNFYQ